MFPFTNAARRREPTLAMEMERIAIPTDGLEGTVWQQRSQQVRLRLSLRLGLGLSLRFKRFKGLLVYTADGLFHVECCIR